MSNNFFKLVDEEVFRFDQVLNYFKDTINVYELKTSTIEGKRKVDFEDIKEHLNIIQCKPNLYGLYTKTDTNSTWELKYIGQRKSGKMRERLRQHLFKRHDKTGAKLEIVKKELNKGSFIGIALFQVVPDLLRHYYEERLIQSVDLDWNNQKHKK